MIHAMVKPVGIRDVAAEAGVSVGTDSSGGEWPTLVCAPQGLTLGARGVTPIAWFAFPDLMSAARKPQPLSLPKSHLLY